MTETNLGTNQLNLTKAMLFPISKGNIVNCIFLPLIPILVAFCACEHILLQIIFLVPMCGYGWKLIDSLRCADSDYSAPDWTIENIFGAWWNGLCLALFIVATMVIFLVPITFLTLSEMTLEPEFRKAQSVVRDATFKIKRNSTDFSALLERGKAYEKLDKYWLAIKDFESVLSLKPKDKEAHERLGVIFTEVGQVGEALENFILALDSKGNSKVEAVKNVAEKEQDLIISSIQNKATDEDYEAPKQDLPGQSEDNSIDVSKSYIYSTEELIKLLPLRTRISLFQDHSNDSKLQDILRGQINKYFLPVLLIVSGVAFFFSLPILLASIVRASGDRSLFQLYHFKEAYFFAKSSYWKAMIVIVVTPLAVAGGFFAHASIDRGSNVNNLWPCLLLPYGTIVFFHLVSQTFKSPKPTHNDSTGGVVTRTDEDNQDESNDENETKGTE